MAKQSSKRRRVDWGDALARFFLDCAQLPTKGFIVAAVIASLTIIGALITVAPRLQSLVGTAPVSGQTAH